MLSWTKIPAVLHKRKVLPCLVSGWFNVGRCPICQKTALFLRQGEWLRDQYICLVCSSIPRQRALVVVLEEQFPDWRNLAIHESSPCGASSRMIASQCHRYVASQFYSDVPPGSFKDGFRSENLENMTFEDESFDLLLTQDVFEHVLNPAPAFREIHRTLKPGGAHVFTMPWYYWQKTRIRAVETARGIEHLEEPVYHGNPVDEKGSLVTIDWGDDFIDFIYENSGLTTTVYRSFNRELGLEAKFLEVFVSRKRL